MLVLTIAGVLSALFGVYLLLHAFNARSRALFGYASLTLGKVLLMGLAGCLLYAGYEWRAYAVRVGHDPLNGVTVMIAGLGVAAWLAYQNYKRTNVLFGTAATLMHMSLAPFALQFGVMFALLAVCALLLAAAVARPVYVVNM